VLLAVLGWHPDAPHSRTAVPPTPGSITIQQPAPKP
jgi:hypothetical protein